MKRLTNAEKAEIHKELEEAEKAKFKPYENKIAELEKENAELKKLKRECETSLCRAEYQYNYEQLTKAKDHIKKLLDCLKQDTNDPETNYYVCQYMDKAEQFLNSEVEK